MFSFPEAPQVFSAMKEAGEIVLCYWPGRQGSGKSLVADQKEDGSPVTTADLESSELLVSRLKEIFPRALVISEEEKPSVSGVSEKELVFIDPIDGTKLFMAGENTFGMLVALCRDGTPAQGYMYFPALDEFYHGGIGAEARCSIEGIIGQPQSNTLQKRSVYLRSQSTKSHPVFLTEHLDSGVAFRMLFQGTLQGVVFELHSLGPWDLAAPAALITSLGGTVSNRDGSPFSFSADCDLCGQWFVATRGPVHEELLCLLQTV